VNGECSAWCTALLWIVPAKVQGNWRVGANTLALQQQFQMVSGALGSTALSGGRLRGEEITFTVGDATYTGRVDGNVMKGAVTGGTGGTFEATRQ
jgi:hypothetical protein